MKLNDVLSHSPRLHTKWTFVNILICLLKKSCTRFKLIAFSNINLWSVLQILAVSDSLSGPPDFYFILLIVFHSPYHIKFCWISLVARSLFQWFYVPHFIDIRCSNCDVWVYSGPSWLQPSIIMVLWVL